LVLGLAIFSGQLAAATGDVSFGASNLGVTRGGTVNVPVLIDAGPAALGAHDFELRYDQTRVVVDAILAGTAPEFSSDPLTNPATFASGTTRFMALNASSLLSPTGQVQVATIVFRAVGDPGTSTVLHIDVNTLVDTGGIAIEPINTIDSTLAITAAAVSVPRLSGWSLIWLAVLLVGAAWLMLRGSGGSAGLGLVLLLALSASYAPDTSPSKVPTN